MKRQAEVWVDDLRAGYIEETDEGYLFRYDEEYLVGPIATSVSLTLPIRSQPYKSAGLFSFFDGLIPEGWLLAIAENNWKLRSTDRFGLLLACCRDCIGNVSIIVKP